MADLKVFVQAMFSDSLTNWVIVLLLVLPAVQWILGICRAIANKTFDPGLVDVFIRTTVAGRVIPLLILLILGRFVAVGAPNDLQIPGLDISILTGAGVAAAAPFVLSTLNAIFNAVDPHTPDQLPIE